MVDSKLSLFLFGIFELSQVLHHKFSVSAESFVILNGRGRALLSSGTLPSLVQLLIFVDSMLRLEQSSCINNRSSFCRSFGSFDWLSVSSCIIMFLFPLKSSFSSLFCVAPASRMISLRSLITVG